MTDLIFKMNFGSGFVTVDPPKNWIDMKVQLMFDKGQPQLQLQSINFQWVTRNAKKLKAYFDGGLTGASPGIMEGPGLEIWGVEPGYPPVRFFLGCINTADEAFDVQDDIIMCPIKESGRTDWFNTAASGFTYNFLSKLPAGMPGAISRADYKLVPYAISSIPNYTQAMLLSISLFIIIKESVDVVAKIASLITRAISQSLSWLQLIGTIVEIVLYLVYLVAIVTASAKLIQQIADNLIQPKKTKLGMREVDLFVKGCQRLGLNFVSPIYGYGTADLYGGKYANMTVIPEKVVIPTGDPVTEIFTRPADETTNPDSFGYPQGTFADWVKKMEITYNAELIVNNGTAYFQERNQINIVDAFAVPNEGKPGNTFLYPQPYGTNAHELKAIYWLRFQKDDQDLNTFNDAKGTYCLSETKPVIENDHKNQLLGGSIKVDIPFAHARRKVGFTKIEKALLEVLDTYAGFLNGIGDSVDNINNKLSSWMPGIVSSENVGLSNTQVGIIVGFLTGQPVFSVLSIILGSDGLPIIPTVVIPYFSNDRIGWMLLSSDFIGVDKRFAGTPHGNDWYVDQNNSEGQFVTTIPATPVNGTFAGSFFGFGSGPVLPTTVINGIITVNVSVPFLGPGMITISGLVSGYGSTVFTAVITGTASGGFFTGTGMINTATAYSSYNTQGWGSAQSLYYDFHYTNVIDFNQWLVYKDKTFKFTMKDFIRVNNKNILTTADGRSGKFQELMWVLSKDLAESVHYRVKQKWTNNYQITVTEDVG